MHIFFSGIGGAGISSLAFIALDIKLNQNLIISGSDKIQSTTTNKLEKLGIEIYYNQDGQTLHNLHLKSPIDWYIHTAALPENHPELMMAKKLKIKTGKRDQFINWVLSEKELTLVSVCGTHGKTTTTSMLVWLFMQFNIPVSYLIGSNINFSQNFNKSGAYQVDSKFFIMEADEFDKNMLQYNQAVGVVPSLDYDHPDTYPTIEDYQASFASFLSKSSQINFIFEDDLSKIRALLDATTLSKTEILKRNSKPNFASPKIHGSHNRQNAYLASDCFAFLLTSMGYKQQLSLHEIEVKISNFIGTDRRMEQINPSKFPNLYTDYAHHPTEIRSTIQLALEINTNIIVVYQPHQNLRQHSFYNLYQDCFSLAKKVYWLPTFLSREKEGLELLSPKFLTSKLINTEVQVANMDAELEETIKNYLRSNYLVIIMGAGDIDSWARKIK